MDIKAKFIILRKIKYGEADLIVHALSVEGEKVSFIARGALKSKKRFGGGILEPSHFVQLSYRAAKETGQLNVLNEANLIHDFHKVRRSYEHLEFVLHVLECISKVSQEGDHDSDGLFNLLGNTLKLMEVTENIQKARMHFYLKFLLQQGVLEPEPWMTEFLKTHIADSDKIEIQENIINNHLSSLEKTVRHYLESAAVDQRGL